MAEFYDFFGRKIDADETLTYDQLKGLFEQQFGKLDANDDAANKKFFEMVKVLEKIDKNIDKFTDEQKKTVAKLTRIGDRPHPATLKNLDGYEDILSKFAKKLEKISPDLSKERQATARTEAFDSVLKKSIGIGKLTNIKSLGSELLKAVGIRDRAFQQKLDHIAKIQENMAEGFGEGLGNKPQVGPMEQGIEKGMTNSMRKGGFLKQEDELANQINDGLGLKDFLPTGRNLIYRIAQAGEALTKEQQAAVGILEDLQFEAANLLPGLTTGFSQLIGNKLTSLSKDIKQANNTKEVLLAIIPFRKLITSMNERIGKMASYLKDAREGGGIAKTIIGDLLSGLGGLVPAIGAGVGQLLQTVGTFLARPFIAELRNFQELRDTLAISKGYSKEMTKEVNKMYSGYDLVETTGQSISVIQRNQLKLLKRGITDVKVLNKLTETSLNTATLIGADADETANLFADWHQNLRLDNQQLNQMGKAMRTVSYETGLIGENLLKVARSTEKFMTTMKHAGTFTVQASKNMMSLLAEAQKTGTSEGVEKLLGVMSGGTLGDGDEQAKQLLYRATGGRADLMQSLMSGTITQNQDQMKDLGKGLENVLMQWTRGRKLDQLSEYEKGMISQLTKQFEGFGLKEIELIMKNIEDSTKPFADKITDLNKKIATETNKLEKQVLERRLTEMKLGKGLDLLDDSIRGVAINTKEVGALGLKPGQNLNADLIKTITDQLNTQIAQYELGKIGIKNVEDLTGKDPAKAQEILEKRQKEIATAIFAQNNPLSSIDLTLKRIENKIREIVTNTFVEGIGFGLPTPQEMLEGLLNIRGEKGFQDFMEAGNIFDVFKAGWQFLQDMLMRANDGLKKLTGINLAEILGSIWSGIVNVGSAIKSGFDAVTSMLGEIIKLLGGSWTDKAKEAVDTLTGTPNAVPIAQAIGELVPGTLSNEMKAAKATSLEQKRQGGIEQRAMQSNKTNEEIANARKNLASLQGQLTAFKTERDSIGFWDWFASESTNQRANALDRNIKDLTETAIPFQENLIRKLEQKKLEQKNVGTNMVTKSGLAFLHKGEAIVPSNMMNYQDNGPMQSRLPQMGLYDLLKKNDIESQGIKTNVVGPDIDEINDNTGKSATTLQDVRALLTDIKQILSSKKNRSSSSSRSVSPSAESASSEPFFEEILDTEWPNGRYGSLVGLDFDWTDFS